MTALLVGGLASFLPRRVAVALLAAALAFLLALMQVQGGEPPAAAKPYQRALLREARLAGGLDAPVAVFAGQIEQESGWGPNAKSAFANGLAQFTPPTAKDMARKYPSRLGDGKVFNPEWAIRALTTYDRDLYHGFDGATECDRWAFALSAYNGGAGWLNRDRRLCDPAGCTPAVWFGGVDSYTARSAAAARENRAYPKRILFVTQHHYEGWGAIVSCSKS